MLWPYLMAGAALSAAHWARAGMLVLAIESVFVAVLSLGMPGMRLSRRGALGKSP